MKETLDDYIEETISFIKDNIPEEGNMLAFSGGKDSLVTKWCMDKAGHGYELVYTYTTIDPPEVVKFIREHFPECRIIRPKRTFWKMIGPYNPPTFRYRWCCYELKKKPSYYLPHYHRVFGIRSEESNARKEYPRIEVWERNVKRTMPEHKRYYPILHWPEWAVWELIERENIPYPSLYDEGFTRIGCVVCPMRRKPEHDRWRARYPGMYKVFEKCVHRWWHKRNDTGRPMNNDSPKGFMDDWYRQESRWYKGKKKNDSDS